MSALLVIGSILSLAHVISPSSLFRPVLQTENCNSRKNEKSYRKAECEDVQKYQDGPKIIRSIPLRPRETETRKHPHRPASNVKENPEDAPIVTGMESASPTDQVYEQGGEADGANKLHDASIAMLGNHEELRFAQWPNDGTHSRRASNLQNANGASSRRRVK